MRSDLWDILKEQTHVSEAKMVGVSCAKALTTDHISCSRASLQAPGNRFGRCESW